MERALRELCTELRNPVPAETARSTRTRGKGSISAAWGNQAPDSGGV